MSRTYEHIAEMSHTEQQPSITITLIVLKNAFGEVHYLLIQSVRRYHYISDKIKCIVKIMKGSFKNDVTGMG